MVIRGQLKIWAVKLLMYFPFFPLYIGCTLVQKN
uniref:Uncharacterized protein n=1 Tax=Rhizophora mucronata TaxID=61149 RepID=A0A2P2R4H1_RHIMU